MAGRANRLHRVLRKPTYLLGLACVLAVGVGAVVPDIEKLWTGGARAFLHSDAAIGLALLLCWVGVVIAFVGRPISDGFLGE